MSLSVLCNSNGEGGSYVHARSKTGGALDQRRAVRSLTIRPQPGGRAMIMRAYRCNVIVGRGAEFREFGFSQSDP
jgi:hypothetical protein